MAQASPNIEPSIAILQFENLTEEKKFQVICDGFTMDITMELSKFKQFQLFAIDTGIFDEEAKNRIQELIDGTDYYLKGSFRNYEGKIRINAHLIETQTQRLVWADRIENESGELFSIQEELLQQIVATLQDHLDVDLLTQKRKRPKSMLRAYELWLYGINELKKATREGDLIAREYFQKAISIDSNNSLACSGMSLSYFNEWSCQVWKDWEKNQEGAKKWATKALDIDDQNYLANLIAGKIHVFERDYELGEALLRKALSLNSNDPFNLIQIASSFIYLGCLDEAEQLYLRAIRLRPYRKQDYHSVGAFIYFEKGEFQKCLEIGKQYISVPWVDYPAIIAAAYYFIGDLSNCEKNWQLYIEAYKKNIVNEQEFMLADALQWLNDFNPYKGESPLQRFQKFIREREGKFDNDHLVEAHVGNVFIKSDEVWTFAFKNKTVQLSETKGFHDISQLLSRPNENILCSELMGSGIFEVKNEVLDDEAKRQYQSRIIELQEEINEAEIHGNIESLNKLREEYDSLIDHLSKSLNFKGKSRKFQSSSDKARSAVTQRIRNSIKKIESIHPELGGHLFESIRTGTFCSYSPSEPVIWEL